MTLHWTSEATEHAARVDRRAAHTLADAVIALLLVAFLFGLGVAAQRDWARLHTGASQDVTGQPAQQRVEP